MLGIIILIVVFVGGVSGHSYGADLQACDTLKPGHGGVLRQKTRSPYVIQTNNQYYVPCQTQPIVGRMMNCGVIGKSFLFIYFLFVVRSFRFAKLKTTWYRSC